MEYEFKQSYVDKRSSGMATAALVLGICGLVLSLCPYSGFIFGSLAIILGLLSRGGEMTMSSYGKIGVILGSIAMAVSTLVIIVAIVGGFAYGSVHSTSFFEDDTYYDFDYDFDYDSDYDFDDFF